MIRPLHAFPARLSRAERRRRFPRLADRNSVILTVEASADMPELECAALPAFTRDISAEGLRLDVRIPLPVNSSLRLHVALPQTRRAFTVVGDLVWMQENPERRSYTAGLDLRSTPHAALLAWQEAIMRRAEDPGEMHSCAALA
jgi:hypothetical protein